MNVGELRAELSNFNDSDIIYVENGDNGIDRSSFIRVLSHSIDQRSVPVISISSKFSSMDVDAIINEWDDRSYEMDQYDYIDDLFIAAMDAELRKGSFPFNLNDPPACVDKLCAFEEEIMNTKSGAELREQIQKLVNEFIQCRLPEWVKNEGTEHK